ncbi:hypothetical protein HK414_10455 [Ramlibacter terrae]|uniref:Uncharacterized protein n=1 Tax=Ramlibacter terrae TaxID=2732511 RepID=A0ABX6P585_9BURK|nr:hypothetical protein HK414_10455 [Ramlibacter terrae]
MALREDLEVAGRRTKIVQLALAGGDVEQDLRIFTRRVAQLQQEFERAGVVAHHGLHVGAQALELAIGRMVGQRGFARGDGFGAAAFAESLLQRFEVRLHGWADYPAPPRV